MIADEVTQITIPMMPGRSLGPMRGYDHRSYGDGFADVYDDWYGDVTDVDATVSRMVDVAGPTGRVLELGVGTGRLAVPMAQAGLDVAGIDSSDAMLARLAARDTEHLVSSICGDMIDDLPDGPFDAVLVAYNTIFNVLDEAGQRRLFERVAERLSPNGAFVVEAFVPGDDMAVDGTSSEVRVRSMAVDHVVLSVSMHRPEDQVAEGQFVQFTNDGGVTASSLVDPLGHPRATRRHGRNSRAPPRPSARRHGGRGVRCRQCAARVDLSIGETRHDAGRTSGSASPTAATSPTRTGSWSWHEAAEAAGWDGLFLWDHVIRRQPLAADDRSMGDPRPRSLRQRSGSSLGPMVTPLARRRVSVVARHTATLDLLSNGRLRFGVGLGAPDDEFTRFGEDADPKRRARMLDESLDALELLWSGEHVSFAGDQVVVDDVQFLPRPVSGRVPIWVAGGWPGGPPFRRAARFDGVWPVAKAGGYLAVDDFVECVAFVRRERTAPSAIGTATDAFDACYIDRSPAGGSDETLDKIGRLVDGAMTWWIDSLDDPSMPFEQHLDRVHAGPPV